MRPLHPLHLVHFRAIDVDVRDALRVARELRRHASDAIVDYIRDHLFFYLVELGRVAGVVVEPVLGFGGCVVLSATFWTALIELCEEFGWLFCADEVKSGYGHDSDGMLTIDS